VGQEASRIENSMTRATFLAKAGLAACGLYMGSVTGCGSPQVPRPTARGGPAETLIIAHRGASSAAPENTLDAFELAIEAGADMIEFDVRRTADSQLIVFHDADVAGVPIGRLSRAQVAAGTGRTPPLLDQVLASFQGRVRLNVELKEDGYVDRVIALLSSYFGPEDLIITSFLDNVLIRVSQLTEAKTGLVLGIRQPGIYLRTDLAQLFPDARLARCGADYVVPPIELVDAGLLGRTVLQALPSLVWTVNDRETLARCLTDERITGVITDVPARARSLRARLASAPAPSPQRQPRH
jgi:glycerophosphoryl diester phosphodiesterase